MAIIAGNVNCAVLFEYSTILNKILLYDKHRVQADYQRLFEESPIPMWIYNSVSLRFLAVNAAAIQCYGYSQEEFLTMTIQDIRPAEDVATRSQIIKMPSLNSFYDSGRHKHKKKNGEIFYAQVYSHATQFGGRIAKVMLAMDINNRVLIEQKNAELNSIIYHQKKQLDDILASVSEVIWSANADDFVISYINPACITVYGYAPDQLIGDNKKLFEIIHPDDRQYVRAALQQLLNTGSAVFEYRIYHQDGSLKHIINQAVLKEKTNDTPAMLNGIAVDITRIKEAEETLKENARETTSILESITDGFFALDKNWNYTYINSEYERIIQRRREDLLGKNIWENFPRAEPLKFYKELHRAITEHTSVHLEEYIPMLRRWFTINAYPTREGLTVYLRDISEEKKQSIKIQNQHDKLREIAWIQSHKVRGPVASIMGLIDLFNYEDSADPSNKDILEHLKEAVTNLDNVIKEIVDKTDAADPML